MESIKFRHKETGEIKTQINIMEMSKYEKLELDHVVVDIQKELLEMDNDDENLELLEKASEYFCSNYDLCVGYKKAILETMNDQVDNHYHEQDINDFVKLLELLKGK